MIGKPFPHRQVQTTARYALPDQESVRAPYPRVAESDRVDMEQPAVLAGTTSSLLLPFDDTRHARRSSKGPPLSKNHDTIGYTRLKCKSEQASVARMPNIFARDAAMTQFPPAVVLSDATPPQW